ncbi:hemerythrin [Arcticibacterium luteifluviistationis]|uniref:Hemerythrin n=1 Tax=Arcticibacterium luteifluviistationis TaxID=1784714 RepID=A0A2Z4G8N4_9BACT|nr:hemerythrin [Arcticibacterium luteifluviistationis]AWV97514.1 hemerythrin [Arcticibacterium luteifluviistationis]
MIKRLDISTYEAINENFNNFYNSNLELDKPSRKLTEVASQLDMNDLSGTVEKFKGFSTEEIIDYLVFNHHYYLTKKLPELQQSILHVFGHEDVSNLLKTLAMFFGKYQKSLISHIKMEENVFFPMAKDLASSSKEQMSKTKKWTSFIEFLGNHDPIEDELKKVNLIIKEAVKDIKVPFAYSVFMNQIDLFELDLKRHAIIEDEVLLPRVEAML